MLLAKTTEPAASRIPWAAEFTSAAVFEKQVVTTLEPGTRALMLPGIVFLLVTWNRCASGLTLTR